MGGLRLEQVTRHRLQQLVDEWAAAEGWFQCVLRRAQGAWRRCGLDPLGLHEARRTAVSIWIAAGVNIRAVSTYAGHSSVAFILDRYGHLLPCDQAQATALLDRILEGASSA